MEDGLHTMEDGVQVQDARVLLDHIINHMVSLEPHWWWCEGS